MTYTSLLGDYMGGGLDAAKPNPTTLGPTIPAGSSAMYFASDTGKLYVLKGGDTSWSYISTLGGATLDTDTTLAANSDTRIPSQKAVKTYVDNAVTGLLELKGSTDCSANPNYPAALKGDSYVVSVSGKIGGASGKVVSAGDVYFATADNAGGTEASVGTSWDTIVHSGGTGSAITAKDEGTTLTAAMASINFTGAGVTATASGNDVTVNIPGGGGGGVSTLGPGYNRTLATAAALTTAGFAFNYGGTSLVDGTPGVRAASGSDVRMACAFGAFSTLTIFGTDCQLGFTETADNGKYVIQFNVGNGRWIFGRINAGGGYNTDGTQYSGVYGYSRTGNPTWMRVRYASSTMYFGLSNNGDTWNEWGTEGTAFLTPTRFHIGLGDLHYFALS